MEERISEDFIVDRYFVADKGSSLFLLMETATKHFPRFLDKESISWRHLTRNHKCGPHGVTRNPVSIRVENVSTIEEKSI